LQNFYGLLYPLSFSDTFFEPVNFFFPSRYSLWSFPFPLSHPFPPSFLDASSGSDELFGRCRHFSINEMFFFFPVSILTDLRPPLRIDSFLPAWLRLLPLFTLSLLFLFTFMSSQDKTVQEIFNSTPGLSRRMFLFHIGRAPCHELPLDVPPLFPCPLRLSYFAFPFAPIWMRWFLNYSHSRAQSARRFNHH